jgi:hypothetical protein
MPRPTQALIAAAIALQAAVPAAVPALAGSHFNPSFEKGRPMPEGRIDPDTVRRNLCVDLAIKLEPFTAHHPRYGSRPAVRVIVLNVSNVDYVSGRNQQQVQTSFSKRGLGTAIVPFGNIPAGSRLVLASHSTRAGVTATARLVFDPDIRNDGNPANDDCRAGNNKAVVRT